MVRQVHPEFTEGLTMSRRGFPARPEPVEGRTPGFSRIFVATTLLCKASFSLTIAACS